MAYIRKLPSGKWQATVRGPDGSRHTRTDRLQRTVRQWAAEQEAELARAGLSLAGLPVMVLSADVMPGTEREWRGVARERRHGFDPHGFFVYFLWGDDPCRPIYVGKSANVLGRIGTHVTEKRQQIRRVTLLRCQTEQHMNVTEARMIARYKPRLNVVGVRSATALEKGARRSDATPRRA